ncbi:MAG: hypothetical protein O2871_02600 [bacterium]|nr:hypothetical protein [bacterium]
MDEKVSNLFDEFSDEPVEVSNTQDKVNAVENIADDAIESELETTKLPKAFEDSVEQNKVVGKPKSVTPDNNKMWTMAVVASVLILIASATGMVFILLRG